MSLRTLASSLVLAIVIQGSLLAQPGLPVEKGWPDLQLGASFDPPAPERDPTTKEITQSPIRNGALMRQGHYARSAKLPPPVKKLYGQARPVITGWMEREHKLKPVVVAMENAVLVSALPGGVNPRKIPKVQKAWMTTQFGKLKSRLDARQVAHLYALRYLEMEAKLNDLLMVGSKSRPKEARYDPGSNFGLRSRFEFYVFPTEKSYREFCRHFFGVFGLSSSWWFDPKAEVMIACMHTEGMSDAECAARFRNLVAHNVVHGWRGRNAKTPNWVAAGLGHYFENGHRGAKDTFVLNGTPEKQYKPAWDWKPGRNWFTDVRKILSKSESKSMAQLAMIRDDVKLPPRLRVQSWSLVAFMLAQEGGRFRVFLDELKVPKELESELETQDRAIRKAYGVDMATFEKRWRAWVSKTKPPKRR